MRAATPPPPASAAACEAAAASAAPGADIPAPGATPAPAAAAPPPRASAAVTAALLSLSACFGVLLALQVSVNSRASAHFGLFFLPVVLTFGGGLALLTCAVAAEVARSRGRVRCLRWRPAPRWFDLLPGPLGVVYVTGAVLIAALIGSSLLFVGLVLGQLVVGAAIDALGLSGVRVAVSATRALGVLGAAAGAAASVFSGGAASGSRDAPPPPPPLLSVAAFAGALVLGAVLPAQAAVLRTSSQRLPSRLQAAWWSFALGLLTALLCLGAQALALPGAAAALPARAAQGSAPFMYVGGVCGVGFVVGSAAIVPVVGAAAYFVAIVCGQLVGGAALDAAGALGSPVRAVDAGRAIGIAMVMLSAGAFAAPPDALARLRAALPCPPQAQPPAAPPPPAATDAAELLQGGGGKGAPRGQAEVQDWSAVVAVTADEPAVK